MASIYARGGVLWARIKGLKKPGEWARVPTDHNGTPYRLGEEDKAQRWADVIEREIAESAAKAAAGAGALTLAAYAERRAPLRKELGVHSWRNEETRLRLHVVPALGHLALGEVRPAQVRDLFRELTKAVRRGEIAPRTVLDIYGILHCLFEDAIGDELLEHNPCRLKQNGRELPVKVDADPEWRANATYTVHEIERLISDPVVAVERRVLHSLKSIGGLRHEEAAALRWRNYQPELEPLGKLRIARAYDSKNRVEKEPKNGQPRDMPVHPVLAKILAAWKISHWERIYGRPPGPDDLIVPTRAGNPINVSDAGHDLTEDLERLGLRTEAGRRRKRGGHDLRAWFITSCQEHGAHRDLLRMCTHGPGKGVIDGYTRATWASRCAQVALLKVAILGGEVLALGTAFSTVELRASNRWGKESEPRRSRTFDPRLKRPVLYH